jgi:hypothetical protein
VPKILGMGLFILFATDTPSAFSQPLTFGVKGGVPLTHLLSANQSPIEAGRYNATSYTNRYLVGPALELRLPANFSIEFDALFRHFSYQSTIGHIGTSEKITATSNTWEFPVLCKYKLPGRLVKPYIVGGVAWDRLQGLSATRVATFFNTTTVTRSLPPPNFRVEPRLGSLPASALTSIRSSSTFYPKSATRGGHRSASRS